MEQYPPLFHSATNVPSFLKAFKSMPNLQHLHVFCGRDAPCGEQRSIADYILISLRVALENSSLESLDSLHLTMHKSSLKHLQLTSFGANPRATRRWTRIENLELVLHGHQMTQIPTHGIHSFVRQFQGLRTLRFQWLGERGPFPLDSETLQTKKCDIPLIRRLEVYNATATSNQVSSLFARHWRTLCSVNLEDVKLINGTWDTALNPLTRLCGHDDWKQPPVESMDVPLLYDPPKAEETNVVTEEPRVNNVDPRKSHFHQ